MQEDKTMQQEIMEENKRILNYEEELERAIDKALLLECQSYDLECVKKSEAIIGKNLLRIIAISACCMAFIFPLIGTNGSFSILASIISLSVGACSYIFATEQERLEKEAKKSVDFAYYKSLSKKEKKEKSEELEIAKKYEEANIENLKECIEIERNELAKLISKLAYQEKVKEVVGKELEKTFLQYLDEKVEYKSIHFDTDSVEKVKIKSKIR